MRRVLLLIPIVGLFVVILVGAHAYVIDRMVTAPGLPDVLTSALTFGIVALGATLVLQPIGERLLRPRWARWVAWPASLWMGSAFLLLLALGATDALLWLSGTPAHAAESAAGDSGAGVARARAAAVLLVVGGASAWAMRTALAPPALRRVEIALERWPRALDGFRVVQISDIHIGPILDRRFAADLTERVTALDADLVAVTGDLVDGRVSLLREEVAPFAGLRGRHGVFFVTGNHDHYSGARAWAAEAARLGMRVLRNEHVVLEQAGERFVVAGVDDHRANMLPGEEGEDLDAALDGVDPELPLLLLAHDPSTFKRASGEGIDLQISGHTHGGQIWPFEYLVRLAVPFVAGLYRRGRAALYVSRGTGFWGPPMRLGAPAEITEIVLRAGR